MKCPYCSKEVQLVKVGPRPVQPALPTASVPVGDIAEFLDKIDDARLNEKSKEFVTETRARFEKYGDNIRMSPKQLAWLDKAANGGCYIDSEEW